MNMFMDPFHRTWVAGRDLRKGRSVEGFPAQGSILLVAEVEQSQGRYLVQQVSCCVRCTHPLSECMVSVLAPSLLIQFPANVVDDIKTRIPTTHMETQTEFQLLTLAWSIPGWTCGTFIQVEGNTSKDKDNNT